MYYRLDAGAVVRGQADMALGEVPRAPTAHFILGRG